MYYEKLYKEALERAKSKIKNNKDHVLYEDDIIEMFQELKESEDERTRKAILDCFITMKKQGCFPAKHKEQYKSWIAWLDKQGGKDNYPNLPKFTFNDVLALQCAMENVKVQMDKDLYNNLLLLYNKVYDAYSVTKR